MPGELSTAELRAVAVQGSGYRAAKRSLDIVVAALGLVVLSPIILLIALTIVADSRGSAFFLQERVGRHRKRFRMIKFRTMVAGNDEAIHRRYVSDLIQGVAPARPNPAGESVYLLDDPRVTRIGRFLRRSSLDELPNLVNVLAGDMSLVGPRPPISYEVEMYDDRSMRRLAVKPGMTGLAQVRGRGALNFSQVVAYDLEYVDRASFAFDLKIILQTIPAVFRKRGV